MTRSLITFLFLLALGCTRAQSPVSLMYNGGFNHLVGLPNGRSVFSGPQHNVMCIDSTGNVLWRERMNNGSGNYGFLNVLPSADGGAMLLTATTAQGGLQPTVIKLNGDGSTAWGRVITCANSDVVVSGMARTTLGFTVVLVLDYNGAPLGVRDLISLSDDGDVEWAMRYDTTQANNPPATVIPGPDGGVFLLVTMNRLVYVSATGQVMWGRQYSTDVIGAQVLPSGDLALHVRPWAYEQGVLITDAQGMPQHCTTFSAGIAFRGSFEQTPNGQLVAGLAMNVSGVQLMVTDTTGALLSNTVSDPSTVLDGGADVEVLPDGRITALSNRGLLWTYFFRSDAALDLGACFAPAEVTTQTLVITSSNYPFVLEQAPVLVASFDPSWEALPTTTMVPCASTGVVASSNARTIEVYPVPADGDHLHLRHAGAGTYRVVDAQGRALLNGLLAGDDASIDVRTLTPGAYVLVLRGSAGEHRVPFVR